MRVRIIAAVGVLVALAVAASSATGGTPASKARPAANSITVWLQVDAQSGWADVVADATKAFKSQHPDVNVDVQYQTWGTHLAKFDATLAGGNTPDVIEMGNTEMTKYMAAGAFADITADKGSFPNSSTWLKGLELSCRFNGKLYGVPYYAGSRVVIYRKDNYKQAGINRLPTSLDEFLANGNKLVSKFGKSNKNFSAFYLAGRDWYSGLAFVYDYGGTIAVQTSGKWKGALDSKKSIQGLTKLKQVFAALSRASKTTDEAHPFPTIPFAQGRAASFIGPGWQFGYALDPKVGNPKLKPVMGAYAMPSHVKGQVMPGFLGGSDLAIPASSKNKDLAKDWIKAFTSTAAETGIVKAGNIANTTTLLNLNKGTPGAALGQAAKNSWFVPTAKNWVNVENAGVLQDMLTAIYTGDLSVRDAAKRASDRITEILNA
jgi:N,N'-diacetylchitobiose transport system substrate-binding protein